MRRRASGVLCQKLSVFGQQPLIGIQAACSIVAKTPNPYSVKQIMFGDGNPGNSVNYQVAFLKALQTGQPQASLIVFANGRTSNEYLTAMDKPAFH